MRWRNLSDDVRCFEVPSGWIYEIWGPTGMHGERRASYQFVPDAKVFAREAMEAFDVMLEKAVDQFRTTIGGSDEP